VLAQSNKELESSEEYDDDDVFEDEASNKSHKKSSNNNKKLNEKKLISNKKSQDAKFNIRKRVRQASQSSSRSSRSSRGSLSSSSNVSSLSSVDSTCTRKDGKLLKKQRYAVSSRKRRRVLSSSDESVVSEEKVSRGRGRPKSTKNNANEKPSYQSQLDFIVSSSDSSMLVDSSDNEAREINKSSKFHASKAQSRPVKAFKRSLENKMSTQDTRITAIENNLHEEDDVYNGRNLNDIFAPTGQKMAIKLALAIKGDSLKDHVLTDNGEESANSDRTPWTTRRDCYFYKSHEA
jgi:hypothetical protein